MSLSNRIDPLSITLNSSKFDNGNVNPIAYCQNALIYEYCNKGGISPGIQDICVFYLYKLDPAAWNSVLDYYYENCS